MKKVVKFVVMVFIMICGIAPVFAQYDFYIPDSVNPVEVYTLSGKGEMGVGGVSTGDFTDVEIQVIKKATENWNDIIDVSQHNDVHGDNYALFNILKYEQENAVCTSFEVKIVGEPYLKSALNAIINGKNYELSEALISINEYFNRNYTSYMQIGNPIGRSLDPTVTNNMDTTSYALWHDYNASLVVIVQHEIAHALGLNCQSFKNDGNYYFSKDASSPISIWTKYLRVVDNGNVIVAERGGRIYIDGTKPKMEGDFDIVNNVPYFVGPNTMAVLSELTYTPDGTEETEATFIAAAINAIKNRGGLQNYTDIDNPSRVNGLPIYTIDSLDLGPDLSHIELRNSYMSHQYWRNYVSFMEAELATLKDIGYKINLKDYFGKSYYLDNTTTTLSLYTKEDGTKTSTYESAKTYAIGTHIYSDGNNITQSANIHTTGGGSFGTRIDGVNNKYTLASGSSVVVEGDNSIGVAVTYGKGHTVSIDSASQVITKGNNSPAISFNFGNNVLGDVVESRGSYSRTFTTKEKALLPELKDALVDNFNINGTIISEKSPAIYISESAHVKNINIGNGASISGNIVSEWNSVVCGKYARIKYNSGTEENPDWQSINPEDDTNKYYTNININSDTATEVNKYNFNYTGDILGDSVYTIPGEEISTSYAGNTLKLNIHLNNALTVSDGEHNYNVYNISNNGDLNIASTKTLNLSTLSGEVSGNGNINVKENSTFSLNANVENITNTVNLESGAMLSTLNTEETLLTIKTLNFKNNSVKLAIDLGDTLNITTNATGSGILKNIYVSNDNAELLSDKQSYDLFATDKTITLDTSNLKFYYNGKKYTFSQSGDKTSLVASEDSSQTYDLSYAVADDDIINYIVVEGEKESNNAGTVNSEAFVISGADLDFNGHNGLVVDKDYNKDGTIIKTGVYGANTDLTVQNGACLTVDSTDKEIVLGDINEKAIVLDNKSKSENTTVILNSANNKINVLGKIEGKDNEFNNVVICGTDVELNEVESVTVDTASDIATLNDQAKNVNWNLDAGLVCISKDSNLSSDGTNNVAFNGGVLVLKNNQASEIKLGSMTLNTDANVSIDIDLKTRASDRFAITNTLTTNENFLNVSSVNLVNTKAVLNKNSYKIPFINSELNNTALLGHVDGTKVSAKNILTPILKYNLNYVENNTEGHFALTKTTNGGVNDYNPAVLATPIAAQLGGYLMQVEIYEQAFANMDMMMLMPKEQRQAMKLANKLASTEDRGVFTYSPNQIPEQTKGLYFRPFASFEKVGLSGGPKVESILYGSLFGGESDILELKHGWEMVWGAYAGYIGSHQSYTNSSIYQNGGTFGLNATWYKGNFFTGLTVNVGASNAEISTMYGNENMTMLMTGIASKTGYNWELFKSRFIIQPSWMMSYSFVNMFDYTNAAGVAIHSSPINAIQLAPGIKFIGNLKNGWQPYISVQMIWNIIDDTKVVASSVHLPEMSVNPYVQYGIGLQKRWGDKFSGFGQVMMRNGGRNGVALHFGFRWVFGKESNKTNISFK